MTENSNFSKIDELVEDISSKSDILRAIRYYRDGDKKHLVPALEELNASLEKAVLISRNTLELERPFVTQAKENAPALTSIHVSGAVRIMEMGWLHIKLNTLLPNCRYQTPQYLCDTLVRLTEDFKAQRKKLPYFKNAMLVIDEHCDNISRNVFDNDNKGWKAISNTLKGRVFPDDDQFSLGIALVGSYSNEPGCNIYIMNAADAGEFFMIRENGLLDW